VSRGLGHLLTWENHARLKAKAGDNGCPSLVLAKFV
jgi:hypothetical protein